MKNEPAKILIIDDQKSSALYIASILKQCNYETVVCHNGIDALSLLKKQKFDLVLLDIVMPGMDGYETCRQIKKLPQTERLPVVFITVKTDIESTVKGFKAGAVDYIYKPFNKAELEARVRLQLNLQDAHEQLVLERENALKAERLKSAFLANISHEIRTPMNAIIGFADLLGQKQLSAEERESFLSIISQSAQHLLQLVTDLVDISKLESGVLSIKRETVVLGELMDELYNTYEDERSKLGRQHVDFIYKAYAKFYDRIIKGDRQRIKQVLDNLLNNAFKFTLEGKVEIGIDFLKDNYFRIFIRDTGVGIPTDKREDIFERFNRLHHPGIIDSSGAGLGLTISQSLSELMQCDLWFENNPGGGTIFYFQPKAPCQLSTRPYKSGVNQNEFREGQNQEWEGKTILLADDVPSVHEFFNQALEDTGLRILHAHNGKEALMIFGAEPIDLVFIDLQMPEIDGYEAMKRMKKINPDCPLVTLTALALDDERQTARDAGCDGFLLKPVNVKTVWDTIRKFIN